MPKTEIPDMGKLTPFLPPMDRMTFWRLLMGISSFSFWVFLFYFMAVLYPDLAKSDSVNQLRQEQKEERIMARHRDFCRAEPGSEQADYYLERRNTLMSEYARIDGVPFDAQKLPPCDVLRVPEAADDDE